MRGFIEELIERAKRSKVFKRNKKSLEVKILSVLLYFFGLSLRKVSLFMSLFEEISHESVRKYYHRIKYILKEPRKKERRFIAVDETIIRVGDRKVFVWAAIDVETKECLGIWVSMARHQFLVSEFIRMVLRYCKNKPKFIVDNGVWYRNAFERLGFDYENEKFGRRNAVEQFFSLLKSRTKRFYNRFPKNKVQFKSTLSWLKSFALLHNLINCYYKNITS